MNLDNQYSANARTTSAVPFLEYVMQALQLEKQFRI